MENTFFNIIQETTHQENDFLRVGKKFIQANKLWYKFDFIIPLYKNLMGAKKKVERPPSPPPPPPEKTSNIMLKIITSEGNEFKIHEELFTRYAIKGKILSDAAKDHIIHLK